MNNITKLCQDDIDNAFRNAATQQHYLEELYGLVIPNFGTFEHLDAYPVCNRDTWVYIAEAAIAFDKNLNVSLPRNRQIMPGGAWMNSGFSTDGGDDLFPFEVRAPDEAKIIRKKSA